MADNWAELTSATQQTIGHEWARYAGRTGFAPGEAVGVETNCGVLVLTKLVQVLDGPNAGKVIRQLVKPSELPTITQEECFPQ